MPHLTKESAQLMDAISGKINWILTPSDKIIENYDKLKKINFQFMKRFQA